MLRYPAAVALTLLTAFLLFPSEPQFSRPDATSGDAAKAPRLISDAGDLAPTSRTLRILLPPGVDRAGINQHEQQLLNRFIETEHWGMAWHTARDTGDLIRQLEDGEADVLISVTAELAEDLRGRPLTTIPWGVTRPQILARSGTTVARSLDDLAGRQVAVRRASPVHARLAGSAALPTGMELVEIPESETVAETLEKLQSGHYDLAVLDSLGLPEDTGFHYGVEPVLDLDEDTGLSWAVASTAREMRGRLKRFLSRNHLENDIGRSYRDDLPGIRDRKVLRLITYQGPVNYYYDRGRLKGFEYDLVRRFAENHGMRLDVVVGDTLEGMLTLLEEGKGDLIAASVPESRFLGQPEVRISKPYNYAAPVLIGRTDEHFVDLRDLAGRTIHLPPESPYQAVLTRIRDTGIDFDIVNTGQDLDKESVLFGVSQGLFDLSVIASHEVNAELARQLDLRSQISLNDPQPLVWAVRDDASMLLSALNEYIESVYRTGFYNVLYARYIEKPENPGADTRLLTGMDRLSPYDEIVHRYADRYGFDWRLIVAQIYQESRFDPDAISTAGAEGLMQLLPATADMVGVLQPLDPEHSIDGGIRYLDYLRGLFEDTLTVEERTWFTIASYNAGYKRVQRARAIASTMGLDPDRWFNNVELAMLKLSTPRMHEGEVIRECRCGQTASYVREIRTLYNNYLRLTESVKAVARQNPTSDEI